MPSIGFSLDFLNKFSLSDIETWENFSLSDIEMESFVLIDFMVYPWIGSFGFPFYGLDSRIWLFGFSSLGFGGFQSWVFNPWFLAFFSR